MFKRILNARFSILGLVLGLTLALPGGAGGSSSIRLDLEELAALSDDIAHGTVVSTESRWNEDRTAIVTEVRLEVHEAIKGGSDADLVFVHPGGVVGALRVEVAGVAGFEEGQETVVFVSETEGGARRVTGLTHGRFDVETEAEAAGPASGKFVRLGLQAPLQTAADGEAQAPQPAPAGEAPAESRESLENFLQRVRRAVEVVENEDNP